MSVAMALVAASNTLGEAEWSNMAAINCRWTGVLHTTYRHFYGWITLRPWRKMISTPASFYPRLISESQNAFVRLVSVFTSRPAPSLIHDSLQLRAVTDCEWPSWQLPKGWDPGYKNYICYKYLLQLSRAAHPTDLHGRFGGMKVQSHAAGLHPAQTHVLHLLLTPVLLLFPFLQTLLGHRFVLHDGGSWQDNGIIMLSRSGPWDYM